MKIHASHMQSVSMPQAFRACARLPGAIFLLGIVLAFSGPSRAQSATLGNSQAAAGKAVFQSGCIHCHGPDGRGAPRQAIGFEPPPTFPDFTDCRATAREPNRDWKAIITNGGPARGFIEIMPSFGGTLTAEQIEQVIEYLRSLCREHWPRGELNIPRALMAEKAFPEDEMILSGTINAEGAPATDFKIVYERRFGVGNQMEVSVPFSFARQEEGDGWHGGIGDIALGYKRLLVSSLRTGSILSVQGEAILPTGNRDRGFGTGVFTLETFASYGQLLPRAAFLQFQGGIELPTRPQEVNKAVYGRALFGKSLFREQGLGRIWSPMVELLADREIATDAKTNWDLLPQLQVTLNQRQHIRANIGIKFPINNSGERTTQVMFYLLWDWFDGGLRDGWNSKSYR
jgi:mono/diheme cytochrome c family protein